MPVKKAKPFFIRRTYKDSQDSKFGIYAYVNNRTQEVIYIGKDSNIDKNRRHLDHIAPVNREVQAINRYLQTDHVNEDIDYCVLALANDEDTMNNMEIMFIMFYKSLGHCKFNKAVDITPHLYQDIVDGLIKLKDQWVYS